MCGVRIYMLIKQEVMSLLAHLTVSQPWLKLWLSEPNQLHPLEVQIQQFCESKSPESRLWNNFLKMLTTCATVLWNIENLYFM